MSVARLLIEKELQKIERDIEYANKEIYDHQNHINELNKYLVELDTRKNSFLTDMEKLSD